MSETLPSSLIILKHSIIEGRVPTPENLKVGELALGLFKGQESIWSKNSSGDIVNLRSPRHDLMWGDIFRKFDTREEFYEELNSGNILDTAIVFIKDTCQIWMGGIYYSSSYSEEELEKVLESKITKIPQSVFKLTSESTSSDISKAFGGIMSFISLVNKAAPGDTISVLKHPQGGSIPVSTISSINSEQEYTLNLDYTSNGKYISEEIKLFNDVFSIIKKEISLSEMNDSIKSLESRVTALEETGGGGTGVAESFLWTEIND